MKSILHKFTEDIITKRRNPSKHQFDDLFKDEKTNPFFTISEGTIVYRGRVVRSMDVVGQKNGFNGFDKAGSGVPPPEKTTDMRANYRYIPYLYCTPDKYVAVAELRPHIGCRISIANIRVNKQLKLFDLVTPLALNSDKNKFLSELGELFGIPVDSTDSIRDYIPTQYMAEYIKELGYDGIAYKSSYMNMIRAFDSKLDAKSMCNFVIFNYENTEPVSSDVVNVKDIFFDIEPISSPDDDISNPIERVLRDVL